MVKLPSKTLRPYACGAICALVFLAFYFIQLLNAVRRGDGEPQLILAFFGYPTSWLIFSVFHPLLEWLGPLASMPRRLGEWTLLGVAGVLQYWLLGVGVAFLLTDKGPKSKV